MAIIELIAYLTFRHQLKVNNVQYFCELRLTKCQT